MNEEQEYESYTWDPTVRQFDRFLSREAELCAAERHRRPGLAPHDTLYSATTWARSTSLLGLAQVRATGGA